MKPNPKANEPKIFILRLSLEIISFMNFWHFKEIEIHSTLGLLIKG